MSDIRNVPPSSLLLDSENPRLPTPNGGQREVLRELARQQGKKLVNLARDIAEKGINPGELPIVMSNGDDSKQFIVLEGNRRIAAVKILENPESVSGVLEPSLLKELRTLSQQYQKEPLEDIACTVVKNRADADQWIQLRHTGENDGVGLVRWGSDESQRFLARNRGTKPVHIQALDFLEGANLLTREFRKTVPVTSLSRLLSTPEVRNKLGIEVRDGKFLIRAEPEKVAKALFEVVSQLADKSIKTKDIYSAEDRVDFANSLPKSLVVKPTLTHPIEPGSSNTASSDGDQSRKLAKPVKVTKLAKIEKARDFLIPRDCVLQVSDGRCKEIEQELRTLRLEAFTNATSVLFRVFVELSVDHYISTHQMAIDDMAPLGKKISAVGEALVASKKLTPQQLKPVKRAHAPDSHLAPSVLLMHAYIHSRYTYPAPSDLRASWNGLQPFLTAIWS